MLSDFSASLDLFVEIIALELLLLEITTYLCEDF